MLVELFTSAFCGPCRVARSVVTEAVRLVPGARVEEVDVAAQVERAAAMEIRSTPTVVLRDASGAEVFRSSGAPTLPQVLAAMGRAL